MICVIRIYNQIPYNISCPNLIKLQPNRVLLPFAVPPKRVVLEEPLPRRSGSEVSLACTAEDSNPRTTLLWFRGSGEPILDAGMSK